MHNSNIGRPLAIRQWILEDVKPWQIANRPGAHCAFLDLTPFLVSVTAFGERLIM